MSRLRALGLRARLGFALVAVAALAIGIATVLGDLGLEPRLEDSAQARLARAANHFAEVSAVVYAEAGSWERARPTLRHLAALDDLQAQIAIDGGSDRTI